MPFIEFEVWCSCGRGLCNQCSEKKGGIEVEPCEHCLAMAKDEGWDEGYKEAHEEMRKDD